VSFKECFQKVQIKKEHGITPRKLKIIIFLIKLIQKKRRIGLGLFWEMVLLVKTDSD
jgi:hypothetical protein